MRKSRLKPISDKRKLQIIEDKEVYRQLCERAGGEWKGSLCLGGFCELCHNPPSAPDWLLHSHEPEFGGRGKRVVSLQTSLMSCNKCHDHSKYKDGLPISTEEQLELIKKINREHGIEVK